MKHKIRITLVALILGVAVVLSGCMTPQTGTERSDRAAETMQIVENDIRATVLNINWTGRALASLISPEQADMTKAFDEYSTSVDVLAKSRDTYFEHSMSMGVHGREYFEEWRIQNAAYVNPRIRSLSEDRREKLIKVYAEVAEKSVGLNGSLDSHVSMHEEIRTFFSTDLTPAAAQSITPISLRAIVEGFSLNSEFEELLGAISAIRYELSSGDEE